MTARSTHFRTVLALSAAGAATIAASSSAAAQDMNYEERVYEYAQPIPADAVEEAQVEEPVLEPAEPIEAPVVFSSEPVIQPVPAPEPVRQVRYVKQPQRAPVQQVIRTEVAEPIRTREIVYETEREIAPRHHAAPHHQGVQHRPVHHQTMHQQPVHAGPPAPPTFDRAAWLDDCRDRIDDGRDGNGGVIGGLLGAVAGGLIGNRVADGNRLAGTLIGGGLGGLAGVAVGSAIGRSNRDRDLDECEAYLERWEYQQRYGAGYGPGYAGYATHGYAYVPVTVAVPQRAIVREYVTTEVYTDYEEVVETVHHRPVAPKPVTRQRYIKGK